jgi:hypothetical protein
MRRLVLGLVLTAGCAATALAVTARSPRAQSLERVKGTLYVVRSTGTVRWDLVKIRDGRVVSTKRQELPPLAARNRPQTSLPRQHFFGGDHMGNGRFYTDTTACDPMAISPNGVNAACLRSDGHGTLTVFRVARPTETQKNAPVTVGEYSRLMMGFVSEGRLAVVADDESCPFFRRADRRFAEEPQGRVKMVDMAGKIVGSGPCVHGLVAGDGKLAYLQHDSMELPLYSLDGRTWSKGTPATFDGTGSLLVIDEHRDLVDTHGRLVARDVGAAFWTR